MIWLLTTTEVWSAERPDIGYTIRVCEGEYPNEIENVEELLKQDRRQKTVTRTIVERISS
jgi:hypothetical protein